jgi:hypothetical protein
MATAAEAARREAELLLEHPPCGDWADKLTAAQLEELGEREGKGAVEKVLAERRKQRDAFERVRSLKKSGARTHRPNPVLDALRDNGLISRERAFIAGTGGADLFRAKRLYVYTSDYYSGHTPLILATSQRVLAARLQRLAERKAAAAPPPAPPLAHGGIVLLMRNGGEARAVQNSDELLARLAAQHPGVKIDAFVPGSPGRSYVECAGAVYGARVIIGPHGANLNNFVGARPGATVRGDGAAAPRPCRVTAPRSPPPVSPHRPRPLPRPPPRARARPGD